jgi:hypothetical protein
MYFLWSIHDDISVENIFTAIGYDDSFYILGIVYFEGVYSVFTIVDKIADAVLGIDDIHVLHNGSLHEVLELGFVQFDFVVLQNVLDHRHYFLFPSLFTDKLIHVIVFFVFETNTQKYVFTALSVVREWYVEWFVYFLWKWGFHTVDTVDDFVAVFASFTSVGVYDIFALKHRIRVIAVLIMVTGKYHVTVFVSFGTVCVVAIFVVEGEHIQKRHFLEQIFEVLVKASGYIFFSKISGIPIVWSP